MVRRAAIAGGAAYAGKKAGERGAAQERHESEQEARIRELEAEQARTAQPPAGPPPAAAGSTDDKIEQLKKLGELRDAGVLTDDEFQEEKQKILQGP